MPIHQFFLDGEYIATTKLKNEELLLRLYSIAQPIVVDEDEFPIFTRKPKGNEVISLDARQTTATLEDARKQTKVSLGIRFFSFTCDVSDFSKKMRLGKDLFPRQIDLDLSDERVDLSEFARKNNLISAEIRSALTKGQIVTQLPKPLTEKMSRSGHSFRRVAPI